MPDVIVAILATATVIAATTALHHRRRSLVLAGISASCAAAVVAVALVELNKPQMVVALGVACLMLGVIVGGVREPRGDAAGSPLESHLARCRRRGESASVLVVGLSRSPRKEALEELRNTDTAVVRRVGKLWEMRAILDGRDVPRDVVEARLRLPLAVSTPVFGWASFPTDGLTLEALFEHARAEARRPSAEDAPRRGRGSSGAADEATPAV